LRKGRNLIAMKDTLEDYRRHQKAREQMGRHHAARLKALCLVLVISDNAQVLIMCLILYVAKDD
jgi:hypothetical protein